jgi:hypothetical protein
MGWDGVRKFGRQAGALFLEATTFINGVASVLENPAVTGKINFQVASTAITHEAFKKVAAHIRAGKITVIYSPAAKHNEYLLVENQIILQTTDTTSHNARGLIVHEAVHAIHDVAGCIGLIKYKDEAAAYLAQALYLYDNGYTSDSFTLGTNPSLYMALVVIEGWEGKRPMFITDADINCIKDGLMSTNDRTGDYKKILNERTPYNGVPK